MFKLLRLLAAALLVAASAIAAQAAPTTLELSPGVTVTLPERPDMTSVEDVPIIQELARQFTASTNLYLAGYISPAIMDNWRKGSSAQWDRWAFIQTPRAALYQEIKPKDLDSVLAELNSIKIDPAKSKEISDLINGEIKDVQAALSKKINTDLKMENKSNILTDVEKLDDGIIRFSMIHNLDIADKPFRVFLGGAIFIVRSRLLYVYVYSSVNDGRELASASQMAVEWARAIAEVNRQ